MAGTVISGGLGITGKIWSKGGIVVERSTAVGSRASGVSIGYDSVAWAANGTITDANRHMSLVSNVASSGTYLNMRNLTATNGWDMVVEGVGNNRFIWQSSPISGAAGTTWMTLDSVNGNLTLNGTNDSSSVATSSLYTLGGIYCTKTIRSAGSTVTTTINGAVTSSVTNTNVGSSAYAQRTLGNDGANSAIWFLNSSARTVDGGANTMTLRNDAGAVRLLSAGSLGLSLAATTGNAVLDGTLTVSSGLDAASATNGGSATIAGGLAVAKSTYIGGNLVVTGTVSITGAVSTPTLTTTAGDMVNVTTLVVKTARMVVTNNQNMLYVSFKVTPTAASLNTQFTFTLPGRTTAFVENLDMDNGQCSGFTDTTNLVVLQNVLCTGVPGATKAVIKFQSVSTAVHYLQAFVSYSAV